MVTRNITKHKGWHHNTKTITKGDYNPTRFVTFCSLKLNVGNGTITKGYKKSSRDKLSEVFQDPFTAERFF